MESNLFSNIFSCVHLVCRPSQGAWRRSGSLCAETPISPSESPAVSTTQTTTRMRVNDVAADHEFPHKSAGIAAASYFILSVSHRSIKRPLLKLQVVHVQLLREHAARRHGDLGDETAAGVGSLLCAS